MTVYRMPEWAAAPCSNPDDCIEEQPHTHHAKWWYRVWLALVPTQLDSE